MVPRGSQGLERSGRGGLCLMGTEFQFGKMDGGDACTQYECT